MSWSSKVKGPVSRVIYTTPGKLARSRTQLHVPKLAVRETRTCFLSVDPRRGNAGEPGIAMLNDPVEIFVFWLVYLSELKFFINFSHFWNFISCFLRFIILAAYICCFIIPTSMRACVKLLQLCPTLWDPMGGRPPGSSVPGIL